MSDSTQIETSFKITSLVERQILSTAKVKIYDFFCEQVFRKSSILVQRPQLLQAPGTSLCSRLVDSCKEFKDTTMVIDDQIVMSQITPMVSFKACDLDLIYFKV